MSTTLPPHSLFKGDPHTRVICGFGTEDEPEDVSAWTFTGSVDEYDVTQTFEVGSGLVVDDPASGIVRFGIGEDFFADVPAGTYRFILRAAPPDRDPLYVTFDLILHDKVA